MTSASELLAPGSLFARKMPGYEARPGQMKMADIVERALAHRMKLEMESPLGASVVSLIEGPTGTGKAVGYLLPIIKAIFELGSNRAIIGTANIALQEQLIHKDLPFLQGILPWDFKFALLKGNGNFLCMRKYLAFRDNPGKQAPTLAKVNEWLKSTRTGDKAELEFDAKELWPSISCQGARCLKRNCAQVDACFAQKAKRGVKDAHIVVVNYHLLLANFRYREFLPSFDILVCDEVHALPDICRSFYSDDFSIVSVGRMVSRMNHFAVKETADEILDRLTDALAPIEEYLRNDNGKPSQTKIFYGGEFDFAPLLEANAKALDEVTQHMPDVGKKEPYAKWELLVKQMRLFRKRVEFLQKGTTDTTVCWASMRTKNVPQVNAAPIMVDHILGSNLQLPDVATILTSATMTTGGEFNFLKDELGIEDENVKDATRVESPFDYPSQSLLYLPEVAPPNTDKFIPESWAVVEELLPYIQGGVLFLCTSNYAMGQYSERIENMIRSGMLDRTLMRQKDAGRRVLMDRMRDGHNMILVATRSFFEGVDLAGDALTCVIIDKLPFPVPSDPVVSSLQDVLGKDMGQSGWFLYSLPKAVIDICQASGRLIRRKTDRGLVVILDPRLGYKQYRWEFFKSLPPFPRTSDFNAVRAFLGEPESLPAPPLRNDTTIDYVEEEDVPF